MGCCTTRDFQALESAWRGMHWLLGRTKGDQVEGRAARRFPGGASRGSKRL